MTLEMFVRPWEKLVMSMRFTEVCLPDAQSSVQSGVDLNLRSANVADSRISSELYDTNVMLEESPITYLPKRLSEVRERSLHDYNKSVLSLTLMR